MSTSTNPMHRYRELVESLADGHEVDAIDVTRITEAVKRSVADLEWDVRIAIATREETACLGISGGSQ